mgnify:FL=1
MTDHEQAIDDGVVATTTAAWLTMVYVPICLLIGGHAWSRAELVHGQLWFTPYMSPYRGEGARSSG